MSVGPIVLIVSIGKEINPVLPHVLNTLMKLTCQSRIILGIILLFSVATMGCSSLGLTCFPTGHFLKENAESVLETTPTGVGLMSVPRELDLSVIPIHYLQPGDVLLIEPLDLDSDIQIPGDQKVIHDGTIDLGKYGRVIVAGLTLEMTENLIARTIVDFGEKSTGVNVRLLEPVSKFYVLGEVNSPGSYPLEGNETVLDGILTAGGLTSGAAPCKILLARPTDVCSCRITLPVCYREITQLGDTRTNYQLKPGDRIFVATRNWCDELKFWDASKSCRHCCGNQVACSDPNLAVPSAGSIENPIRQTSAVSGDVSSETRWMESMPNAGGQVSTPDSVSVSSANLVDGVFSPQGDSFEAVMTVDLPEVKGLPGSADGELDFDSSSAMKGRFEPLWIEPATEN